MPDRKDGEITWAATLGSVRSQIHENLSGIPTIETSEVVDAMDSSTAIDTSTTAEMFEQLLKEIADLKRQLQDIKQAVDSLDPREIKRVTSLGTVFQPEE